ncbi:MAG: PQQ-dependent sugar dehydrogenase [Roseibacillus sp.]
MTLNPFSGFSALCLLAIQTNAATIDWTTSDIADVNDIDSTGTFITAQNFSGTGAPSVVTIAGIDFAENNSLTNDNNGDFFSLVTGNSDYDVFLGDLDFTPNGETSVTIPLSVDSGTSYRVQVWYADDGGFNASPQRTMTLTGTGDNVLNGNDYAIGTFTANSTSQNLVVTSSRQGVRLTGYQLRETFVPPTGPVIVADTAADYIDAATFPTGWQYFEATAASGGTEAALAANQSVGDSANIGFGGAGDVDSASILGSGSPYRLYSSAGHSGVAGTDLLIQPGNDSDDAFIIARYTISAADIANGVNAEIAGSFRDLQGGTSGNGGNSVAVSVYHNSTSLFSATGSAGRLFEVDGTFLLSNVVVAAGDTISFVVGNNSHFGGDETALQATIELSSSSPPGVVDDLFNVITSSTTFLDVLSNDTGNWDLTTLQVTTPPTEGTASVQVDGTIEYVQGGCVGNDVFAYSVEDLDNNLYSGEVTVIANNGNKESYGDTLSFPLEAPSGGFSFPDAFPGITFSQPTCLEHLSGDTSKLVVTERSGQIYLVNDIDSASPSRSLLLDIPNVRTSTFAGLRGVAFHPDFANNRYFYVGYDSTVGFGGAPDSIRISRFTANANDLNEASSATEVILHQARTGDGSGQGIHRINRMLFGPDGYLYIAVGDDGNFTGPAHTQRIDDDIWSSVLRIDVDKKAGNYEPANLDGVTLNGGLAYYSIPADNPYVDQNFTDGRGVTTFNGQAIPTGNAYEVRTEMYCVGFRNPWKIGFVPNTGELWVADDGAAGYEKLSIMPPGGNAGWGYFEGTDPGVLQLGSNRYSGPFFDPPAGVDFIQPVMQYLRPGSNDTGGVKSIIGGAFYQSTDIPVLAGAYVFADYTSGEIWYMHRPDHGDFQTVQRVAVGGDWGMDETGMTTSVLSTSSNFETKTYGASSPVRIGSEGGIVAMETDPGDGSILMLDYGGQIRRITFDVDDGSLPQTLTETGAFSNVATLTPSAAVVPYDLNLRFWSDHADKTRFFALKEATDMVTYSEDGLWEAPAGGVWVKHFDMDLNLQNPGTNVQRLETRFIVKTEDDFYAVSYRWNTAQTEATLADASGESIPLPTITEADGSTRSQPNWFIPSRGECRTCHTNDNGVMLGFNTRQQNRPGSLGGVSGNLLELLYETGYLDKGAGAAPVAANLPKFYTPDDVSVNLEERVRSYLAVNCSYCHYEGTTEISVGDTWKGDPNLSIEETNLLHGEGIGFAVADSTDRFVIPGNPNKSMILSLASASNGYTRMPPIATEIIDQEGVTLITDWINNYANAKPTLDAAAGPYAVIENSTSGTVVGAGPQVTDLDDPDPTRGTLTYSIVGGNEGSYYDINPLTGEIGLVQNGLDFEESPADVLSILVSDGFAPNPGEVMTTVNINVTDIPNDDSQGDGIHDEWALANLGSSAVNPAGDTDQDGSPEILEFWADSDPNDPASRGLTICPYEATTTPGNEGYSFEWIIRSDLTIGTDYIIQGSEDLNFSNLTIGTEFTLISSEPIANSPGPDLSRIRVKVPTTADRYFLRISNISP